MEAEDARVEGLIAAIQSLAGGSFDSQIPEPTGDDPLSRIIRAFGALREGLADRDSAIRETEQLSILLQEVNSQLSASRQQLTRLAEQDSLTELGNRRAFLAHLERRVAAISTGAGPFALLFLDLDGFKQINDTRGHRAGDAVLRSVARSLKHALRSVDVPARLGGDEFAAVLEAARPEALPSVGDRLLREVCRPVLFEGEELEVSASAGIVICDRPDESSEALLERADRAMYAAKSAGGGRVELAAAEPQAS